MLLFQRAAPDIALAVPSNTRRQPAAAVSGLQPAATAHNYGLQLKLTANAAATALDYCLSCGLSANAAAAVSGPLHYAMAYES